ncbi:S1 family peptidase [Streptoalloteichus hindustanus]|uniref:Trypsin n=1 Tax=Streptoalloteichus hindustanus TaxID=2017 RepID=A0A1M5ACN6_STRHI|nr:trypsin-like serine protease [Streptoalloteichus hindustanus]SHF27914.1 Trypsin [Streptoalloteichus hindustanus]
MRFARILTALAGAAALSLGAWSPVATAETDGPSATPYIIGGGHAQSGPWAARLFLNGRQQCSASIIAPDWILTARHCVEGSGTFSFRIGNVDQTAGTYAEAKPGGIHTRDDVDLALVNIDREVDTTYAKLGKPDDVREGQTVKIYGWGATRKVSSGEINYQSRYLKVADVRVTDPECSNQLGGPNVCARRVNGIAAGGDSGGPMFAEGSDGETYQVGVASTSDRSSFTTYANVAHFREWVQELAGV